MLFAVIFCNRERQGASRRFRRDLPAASGLLI